MVRNRENRLCSCVVPALEWWLERYVDVFVSALINALRLKELFFLIAILTKLRWKERYSLSKNEHSIIIHPFVFLNPFDSLSIIINNLNFSLFLIQTYSMAPETIFVPWQLLVTIHFHCMQDEQHEHSAKLFLLCSTEQRRYCRFEMVWGRVNDNRMFIFGWSIYFFGLSFVFKQQMTFYSKIFALNVLHKKRKEKKCSSQVLIHIYIIDKNPSDCADLTY